LSIEHVVIERQIFVAASPETVFGFLTDSVLMSEWIGVSQQVDARPGGLLRIQFSRGDVARGHYVESVPHRRVAFTWGWEQGHEGQNPKLTVLSPGASLVEIDHEPKDGGTIVHLRHSYVPKDIAQRHGERWSHYLARLAAAASTLATERN